MEGATANPVVAKQVAFKNITLGMGTPTQRKKWLWTFMYWKGGKCNDTRNKK